MTSPWLHHLVTLHESLVEALRATEAGRSDWRRHVEAAAQSAEWLAERLRGSERQELAVFIRRLASKTRRATSEAAGDAQRLLEAADHMLTEVGV